ncbi:asialoglycoprotein receptor 1-like [Ahaetulla prasina]|uniref:asialoglycoprotein receptor 1-like n=1 Tax=Ahaetulla prasina TaxID=499056 RepID=UPI002647E897|nr:asialoglycoprotein receptor 1-like [Ahaetulla prasina]
MGGFAHQDCRRQRICSGRRVILILMGLLAVVTLSLVVLGFVGRNYSTTLWKMKEDVKASNHTLAVELADLQQKGESHKIPDLGKIDKRKKERKKENRQVKSQFLDQINKLQGTLQKLNCDLEDTKHKRKGPASGCCPRGWHLFQQGCYWLSSAENSWTEAKEDCEEKNAHLVAITSYLEQVDSDSQNSSSNYRDWWPENPNSVPFYCTMMYRDGLWSQAHCMTKLKWMCEKLAQQ